ncbi:MAG: rRNA pseudouridine synthase [Firmicutes bacterium]|nr:rRNA pseudouridine synthase [Bacillota bacterium]
MSEERIQKILAQAGVASRRASEALILAGHVEVNGQIVRTLGAKADPRVDVICVKGKRIRGQRTNVYYLLHKPVGVLSTCHDPQGRPTVLDLLPKIEERVYPVGRLDLDSEGLVFLTNDGDTALVLSHPRYQVQKRYLVEVKGSPSPGVIGRLSRGVKLADGKTAPAKIQLVQELPNSTLLEFEIHEGKNRQIRRMCDAVGHPALSLKRFQVGPFTLDGLALGEYRRLGLGEIDSLMVFVEKAKEVPKKKAKSR